MKVDGRTTRRNQFGREPDAFDILFEHWARTRRQLLGLAKPELARQYIGSTASLAGKTPGASTGGATQKFPEVYEGEDFVVNLAWQAMSEDLRDAVDLRYAHRLSGEKASLWIGVSKREFWSRIECAKKSLSGFMAGWEARNGEIAA